MGYVDVFISHGQKDKPRAGALKKKIEAMGFSCFIDADDPVLAAKKAAGRDEEKALAEHIRQKLRDCRCIIYAHSTQTLSSRWMQWELGFFDGRWGPRQIGRYDLDEGRAQADAPEEDNQSGKAGVLEYLHIYQELTPGNLEDFLRRACSTRALADRADVDVDRLALLLAGMSRDPVNFTFDAWAYLTALQHQFWSQRPGGVGAGGFGSSPAPLEALWRSAMQAGEKMRDMMQPVAAAMQPPAAVQQQGEALTMQGRQASEGALGASRGV